MAFTFRPEPGPCPICGAAHTACTTDSGPITVSQLPARDAAVAPEDATEDVEFTTATYRGQPKQKRRSP